MTFTVIGILGNAGSGKDLAADWLVDRGFVKISLADPIKRFLMNLFGLPPELLWGESDKREETLNITDEAWLDAISKLTLYSSELIGMVKEESKSIAHINLYYKLLDLKFLYGESITPRILLQGLGTDWGRSMDPEMWVRYVHEQIESLKNGAYYTKEQGMVFEPLFKNLKHQGVVIPDHRFNNEIEYTRNRENSFVIRIKRISRPEGKEVGIAKHASEEEQKTISDDRVDLVLEMGEGRENVYRVLEQAYKEQAWEK
jgi:hypothetical protein